MKLLDEVKSLLESGKFQCCGRPINVVSSKERHCTKCNATWHKVDQGWSKKSHDKDDHEFGKVGIDR